MNYLYHNKKQSFMTFKEIQDLVKLIDKTRLTEFSYKTSEYEIKIKGQSEIQTVVATQAPIAAPVVAAPVIASPPPASPVATPAPPQTTEAKVEVSEPKTSANLLEIKSPMVGTFYRAAGPDKPALVNVGDTVSKGSKVCIIEAMKLFNEIESDFSGKIVKVLVEDASPVEYDQVLFLVEP